MSFIIEMSSSELSTKLAVQDNAWSSKFSELTGRNRNERCLIFSLVLPNHFITFCVFLTITQLIPKKVKNKAKKAVELVYSDIIGPCGVATSGRFIYLVN